MTDKTEADALRALIEKVEAGDDKGFRAANRRMFSTPCQSMDLQLREEHSRHAYHGSLDASKALHEALLPEWEYKTDSDAFECSWWCVYKYEVGEHDGFGATHARAWLLAILKAKLADLEA